MDHDFYDWSMLQNRKPVAWPGGKRLALWVNVGLQYFPLNQQGKPFPPPGGMTTAYPDLRHYTLREYGNRVGIYRFFKAFDAFGVRPSFAPSMRAWRSATRIYCGGWWSAAMKSSATAGTWMRRTTAGRMSARKRR